MKKIFTIIIALCVSLLSMTQTTKLDIEGGIKIGNTTTEQTGAIRWNPSTMDFEGFNGTEWVSFTQTAPIWGPQQVTEDLKIIASDGADSAHFGVRVAIQEEVAVVAATEDDISSTDEGSVYVFERVGSGWSEIAKLTASDGASGDQFGSGVAIDGDVIVIGAQNKGGGSAYVFEKPGGGWVDTTETAILTASDAASGDRFGCSVDISGDVIVVGAYFDFLTTSNQGSAYVFVKPGGGWATGNQIAKLTASDAHGSDFFGFKVAISDNVIVTGKYRDDLGGGPNDDKGSVYVFVKPVSGWMNMNQTAKLTASDGAIDDELGYQVDIYGDVVVAGAFLDDHSSTDAGSAYIFEKPIAGWTDMTETAKLTASDAGNGDRFGLGLAMHNDIVVVGAYWDDLAGLNEGSAYVFEKPTGGWVNMHEIAKLTASDAASEDFFGLSLDIFGDWIVVGAYLDDIISKDEGGVYFLER